MKIKHFIPNLNQQKRQTNFQIPQNNKIPKNKTKKFSKFHQQNQILNNMKSKDPST